jgi:hypothetical protein
MWRILIKKNGWKICSKLVGFSKFPTYFYVKTLIDYDYDMKKIETHWYILMLYPLESIKNPITIALSSYFHIYLRKEPDTYFPIFVFLKMYLNAYWNM